jgi:hypothetical protein
VFSVAELHIHAGAESAPAVTVTIAWLRTGKVEAWPDFTPAEGIQYARSLVAGRGNELERVVVSAQRRASWSY